MFSKRCEYGIRAAILIAGKSMENERVSLRYIAKNIGSPEAFTAKILQTLSRGGLIESTKGPNGGFHIDKHKLSAITLQDIIQALDGKSLYERCGLGMEECSEDLPCPIHERYKPIRRALAEMTEKANLQELSLSYVSGKTFLTVIKKITLIKDKRVFKSIK